MSDKNSYILGTDQKELDRLKVQHKTWKSEAQKSWKTANFKLGDTLLDLGCGPGYCSIELANIVGKTGKVIGVDQSTEFIRYLEHIKNQHNLNIEPYLSTFDDLKIEKESLDGIYCRWALAWIPNPEKILAKLYDYLKPEGRMVIHEYYYWTSHRTEPERSGLKKAISASLQSFKDSDSEIDIGKHLHRWFYNLNMRITNSRLMPKIAVPKSDIWNWPKTFYKSYFPRLVSMNYLTNEEMENAFFDLRELEQLPYTTLWCPLMIEVIAIK
ncbi:MAG: class I SAM-dependent methyltransferase [Candidatus Neomarinimicrobiota bacterium]